MGDESYPYCYIDDCRNVATLILESYPDNVYLCDEHRSLHEMQPWERAASVGDPK